MTPEKPAEGKGRDVVQLRRENYIEKIAIRVHRIGQKPEVPEHPADVNKADDAERHPLQFAAGAIAQDRHEQNERDSEDRHSHKKAVPTLARFVSAWMRH